jgi:N-methylhydantoinase A
MALADPSSVRAAVDVGGTFIDLVMVDARTGVTTIEKQPSTPDRLADEIVEAMGRLPAPIAEVGRLFHGSTVVVNAILQERGAKVGLITTHGFRDVLELGRGNRPDIYDWLVTPPDPLVPRHLRREVGERTAADGSEVAPLDLEELDREVDELVAFGVEAVAISFLHSYADPKHETMAAERIRERHPQLSVSASADVAPEWREFERTSTAVLNASVQPLFSRYLDELRERLRANGYERPIAVMQSNGGVIEAGRAAALPVRSLHSGPAGGVIGARALAAELGLADVICTDVGGTSYEVALIQDGEVVERPETEIGRRPVLAPFIDIASIGAGGGSIAFVDETGSLRVGPRSAGARPGPACFGLGGTEPTATDCQLLLGRLDPERFLGSRMRLDVEAARRALDEQVAAPLELGIEDAAEGVLTILETNMSHAIHAMTVERGLDPRGFTLLAYGGAGGFFAAATAEELEIPRVIVPREPAVFSAWGLLCSDYREDAALTHVRPLEAASVTGIFGDLRALRRRVLDELAAYGFEEGDVEVLHRLDLRFEGQEHTMAVPVDDAWLADPEVFLAESARRFTHLHRQRYGHGDPDGPVEVVHARCRGTAAVDRPRWPAWELREPGEPRTSRPVRFRGHGTPDTPVFDRDLLALGQRVDGPAIVEEWTTTILVPPAWHATVDGLGDLVLERA